MYLFWLYRDWIWFLSKSRRITKEPNWWFTLFVQPDWCKCMLNFPNVTIRFIAVFYLQSQLSSSIYNLLWWFLVDGTYDYIQADRILIVSNKEGSHCLFSEKILCCHFLLCLFHLSICSILVFLYVQSSYIYLKK